MHIPHVVNKGAAPEEVNEELAQGDEHSAHGTAEAFRHSEHRVFDDLLVFGVNVLWHNLILEEIRTGAACLPRTAALVGLESGAEAKLSATKDDRESGRPGQRVPSWKLDEIPVASEPDSVENRGGRVAGRVVPYHHIKSTGHRDIVGVTYRMALLVEDRATAERGEHHSVAGQFASVSGSVFLELVVGSPVDLRKWVELPNLVEQSSEARRI